MEDTKKKWMIISWAHIDHADAAYGELLKTFEGTYDEVCAEAREYLPSAAPVGVVGVIE